MEVAAIAAQQAGVQRDAALSMLKEQAQADQAIVNMIVQNSPSGGRGQNLDITV